MRRSTEMNAEMIPLNRLPEAIDSASKMLARQTCYNIDRIVARSIVPHDLGTGRTTWIWELDVRESFIVRKDQFLILSGIWSVSPFISVYVYVDSNRIAYFIPSGISPYHFLIYPNTEVELEPRYTGNVELGISACGFTVLGIAIEMDGRWVRRCPTMMTRQ
jgi:hypothetical protein